jgi:hypothetical protein
MREKFDLRNPSYELLLEYMILKEYRTASLNELIHTNLVYKKMLEKIQKWLNLFLIRKVFDNGNNSTNLE